MTPARTLYLIRYQGPQWFEPFTYFGNNTLKDVYSYEAVQNDWDDKTKSLLWGLQASMWTEFCNSPEDVEYQIFPRLVALADAAWRPQGVSNWSGFLTSLDKFTPYLDRKGVTYAKSMFNIDHKVKDSQVTLSCIRPDVEIRYTVDGTEPTATSATYDKPIDVCCSKVVKAATYRNGEKLARLDP